MMHFRRFALATTLAAGFALPALAQMTAPEPAAPAPAMAAPGAAPEAPAKTDEAAPMQAKKVVHKHHVHHRTSSATKASVPTGAHVESAPAPTPN